MIKLALFLIYLKEKSMKKVFIEDFRKKDEGNLTHIFPGILTIILVAFVAIIFTSWMVNTDRKNAVDLIARKYILRMETMGHLGNEDRTELLHELGEAGLREISLSGTTDMAVLYGNPIYLRISGTMSVFNYQILDTFTLDLAADSIPIIIRRTSTAKH